MFDTFEIITNDFSFNHSINEISRYPLMQEFYSVKNGEKDEQPRILIDETGKEFRGRRLSLIGNPINKTGILNISVVNKIMGYPSLAFRCSIPKYLTGDNFYLATKGDFQRFLLQVEKDFKEFGFRFNPFNCNVFRMDLTKNIVTIHPFSIYVNLLKYVGCRRVSDIKTLIKAETLCIGNKSNMICCYNKIQEMLNNKVELMYGLTRDSNIFRCESRFLNGSKIRDMTHNQIITCSDVLSHYDDLIEYYKTSLRQKLLTSEHLQECEYTVDTNEVLKQSFKREKTEKKIAKDFIDSCISINIKGLLNNIDVNSCVELYEQALLKNGFDEVAKNGYMRKKLSSFRKELNTNIWYWLSKMTDDNKIMMSSLYDELYEKLLGA